MLKHLLTIAATMVLFLVSAVAAKEPIIGFAHVDLNNPYYRAMEKAAYHQAAARGVKIAVVNARNDLASQNPNFTQFIEKSLNRHVKGDWGDVNNHDKQTNDQALKHHQHYDFPRHCSYR